MRFTLDSKVYAALGGCTVMGSLELLRVSDLGCSCFGPFM